MRIAGDERQVLDLGLGDEQTVERVAMMPRKTADGRDVGRLDAQQREPAVGDGLRKQPSYSFGRNRNLPQRGQAGRSDGWRYWS